MLKKAKDEKALDKNANFWEEFEKIENDRDVLYRKGNALQKKIDRHPEQSFGKEIDALNREHDQLESRQAIANEQLSAAKQAFREKIEKHLGLKSTTPA